MIDLQITLFLALYLLIGCVLIEFSVFKNYNRDNYKDRRNLTMAGLTDKQAFCVEFTVLYLLAVFWPAAIVWGLIVTTSKKEG